MKSGFLLLFLTISIYCSHHEVIPTGKNAEIHLSSGDVGILLLIPTYDIYVSGKVDTYIKIEDIAKEMRATPERIMKDWTLSVRGVDYPFEKIIGDTYYIKADWANQGLMANFNENRTRWKGNVAQYDIPFVTKPRVRQPK